MPGAGRTAAGTASPRHRAAARTKLLALIVFALLVVATPRDWFAAFAGYFLLVVAALIAAGVRPAFAVRRLAIEVPFAVFAVFLPFLALGPRVEVLGIPLAVEGLWAAWALLVKSTLAVLASIALVASTEPRRIVLALEQLRLPRPLTSIMAFMLRYLDVILEESRRMQVARTARGFTVRGPREWRILAISVGALFVRSHGRGERIHLAMLARGYDPDQRRRDA